MKRIFEIVLLVVLAAVVFYLGKDKPGVFYYNQGTALYEKHQYKDAQDYFINSLKINPPLRPSIMA